MLEIESSVNGKSQDVDFEDSVHVYLSEIGEYKLLTSGQELRWGTYIQSGRSVRFLETDAAFLQLSQESYKEHVLQLIRVGKTFEGIMAKAAGVEEKAGIKLLTNEQKSLLHEYKKQGRFLEFLKDEPQGDIDFKFFTDYGHKTVSSAFIDHNLRLVIPFARRFIRLADMMDLVSAGNFGLMRAVEKFDPNRGHKFSTYATWWIRQAISRYLDETYYFVRIPSHVHERLRKIHHLREAILGEGVKPTKEMLGERLADIGWSQYKIQNTLNVFFSSTRQPFSLDEKIGVDDDDERSELGALIPSPDSDVLVEVETTFKQQAVMGALQVLTERERKVVALRFGLEDGQERTLEEVGYEIGVTRERIRQIEKRALQKLNGNKTLKSWLE